MRHLDIVGSTQEETLYRLTDWYRVHAGHGRSNMAGPVAVLNFGAPGFIQAHRFAYPLATGQLTHSQWGCTGGSGWYAAALRAVNIPVIYESVDLSVGGHSRNGHGSFRVPTVWKPGATEVGVRILHADDFYSSDLRSYGPYGIIPSNMIFYSTEESREWFEPPLELSVDPETGWPNTESEQRVYNSGRYYRLLQWDVIAGPHLYEYVQHGREHLDLTLQGHWRGGMIEITALPFLFADEREIYLSEIEAAIADLGETAIRGMYHRFLDRLSPRPYDPTKLRIDTVHPAFAYLNDDYWSVMEATGGSGELEWFIVEGELPPGIEFLSQQWARFEGIPTLSGSFDFRIRVTDNSGATAERDTRLAVFQHRLNIIPPTLPEGIARVPYSATLTGTGGSEQGYEWHLQDYSPDWLQIEPTGTPSTVLSGIPPETGVYDLSVRLIDSDDNIDFRAYVLEIYPNPEEIEDGKKRKTRRGVRDH
ncbi:MAG: hypothetical protein ACXAC5_03485 [Promethearchaeota archaeon]